MIGNNLNTAAAYSSLARSDKHNDIYDRSCHSHSSPAFIPTIIPYTSFIIDIPEKKEWEEHSIKNNEELLGLMSKFGGG